MQKKSPRKIIFDMDGVITSEECYWNTAALVVWELLFSRRGLDLPMPPSLPPFDTAPDPALVAAVRRVIFQDDRVITFFKRCLVNSNWDLAFYTFVMQLVLLLDHLAPSLKEGCLDDLLKNDLSVEQLPRLGCMLKTENLLNAWTPAFEMVLNDWAGGAKGAELGGRLFALLAANYPDTTLSPHILTNASTLWEEVRRIFQEWYLGETGYKALYGQAPGVPGKCGLIKAEQPLLPVAAVKKTLAELSSRDWILGIATGRPRNELIPPLEQMELFQYFDSDSVITFDLVEEAQQTMATEGETVSLGKPHPFSLLRAYWGNDCSLKSFFYPPFPSPPVGNCFFVGDAPADLLAARAAGIAFIAVLTGHDGVASRKYFQEQDVSPILPDVTHIPTCLSPSLF